MKRLAALITLLHLLILPAAVLAQDHAGARIVSTDSWVEQWDPVSESWVRIADDAQPQTNVTMITTHIVNGEVVSQTTTQEHNASRYAMPDNSPPGEAGIAQYGPFRVIDSRRAALVGSTGRNSPAQFDVMLRDFPGLEVLEMREAPGTRNDIANLALGRHIRKAGLRTHVPNGGSVRSGAVELFLAGARRTMEPGAQFAVHSWLDNSGRQPGDFAPDAPENRLYLDYYVEMGMSERRARDFYAMTNSAPHEGALWLRAEDMEPWIAPEPTSAIRVDPAPLQVLANAHGALPIPVVSAGPVAIADAIAIAPRIQYADFTSPGQPRIANEQTETL